MKIYEIMLSGNPVKSSLHDHVSLAKIHQFLSLSIMVTIFRVFETNLKYTDPVITVRLLDF